MSENVLPAPRTIAFVFVPFMCWVNLAEPALGVHASVHSAPFISDVEMVIPPAPLCRARKSCPVFRTVTRKLFFDANETTRDTSSADFAIIAYSARSGSTPQAALSPFPLHFLSRSPTLDASSENASDDGKSGDPGYYSCQSLLLPGSITSSHFWRVKKRRRTLRSTGELTVCMLLGRPFENRTTVANRPICVSQRDYYKFSAYDHGS